VLFQYLTKRKKILRGFIRTRLRGHRDAYEAGSWWDEKFFTTGLSDRQTISTDMNPLTSAYHYASVEQIILRHFRNAGVDFREARVCDLGSGSGHWIDFYRSLGVPHCTGIDISQKSAEYLGQKYAQQPEVTILQGGILETLQAQGEAYDLVNAVGIMFHLVDDTEWRQTIDQIAQHLQPGGHLVIGGHFGWLNNVNVQFDEHNAVNKRLRSRFNWSRTLRRAGFGPMTLYRNTAYLFVPDTLPENNVLIAKMYS
jgi:2-polyprenyl-3-methyl-5-hydroxy-6-metoxy-1,4-benzoquinol methylase